MIECEWTRVDDTNMECCYETFCGNVQYFSEGDVLDNSYLFCPYCSHAIKEAPQ